MALIPSIAFCAELSHKKELAGLLINDLKFSIQKLACNLFSLLETKKILS